MVGAVAPDDAGSAARRDAVSEWRGWHVGGVRSAA